MTDFIEDVEFEVIEPVTETTIETTLAEDSLSVDYEKVMDMNKILKNLFVMFPNGDLKKIEV